MTDHHTPGCGAHKAREDDFDGSTDHLLGCIDAFLDLTDDKAFVPHNLDKGSHAYRLLVAARVRLEASIISEGKALASLISAKAECRETEERCDKDRGKAISWANQSVKMLQDAFFPVADALRALEGYLRHTPHHNAPEAAAARKALAVFDTPTTARGER